MKKILLLVLSIALLVIALVAGTTAAYASFNSDDGPSENGGQTWYLFKADPAADYSYDSTGTAYHDYMMQRAIAPGVAGSLSDGNDTFTFNNGDTLLFFADEKANMDVTYPSGQWLLNLQRISKGPGVDKKWGNFVTAKVGYFDGADYTWFGTFAHAFTTTTGEIDTFDVNVPSDFVPQGDTLVIELTNTGLVQQIRQSDGTNLYSPESDPGYPLPEIAVGILFGGGLIGLIGYIIIRKKTVTTTN
jgi:hypothetical protein